MRVANAMAAVLLAVMLLQALLVVRLWGAGGGGRDPTCE